MASQGQTLPLSEKSTYIDECFEKELTTDTSTMKKQQQSCRSVWKTIPPTLCLAALYGCYRHAGLWQSQITSPIHHDFHDLLYASDYTCVPGQTCWPSSSDWNRFNQSIHGNLRVAIPWAAPCYHSNSSDVCRTVTKSYGDEIARTAQYGSTELLDWEICGQSHCFLNSLQPSEPVSGECSLGRLSTYYVEAHTAQDISKTLDFVRQHGIQLSIKNTGHDYFGRSTAANSLALWTYNMKDTKYHKNFQPQGCKTRYENIGEIGAGIQAEEAWNFFEPLGMLVTVGAVGSVGIAGGYGQGGGHGPLGPKHGLMVDQAVEFEVVTADGKMRTINECTDPDLFWAMRGGGGGSYAVLTSYKFQLHPAVPINVYSFQAKFPIPKGTLNITQSEVHRDILTALALNQTLFAEKGVAGYNFVLADHVVSLQVLPSTDVEAIKTITAQWYDFLSSYPDLEIGENKYYSFKTFSEWHNFTETPAVSRNGPVGLGLMMASRLVPRELFSSTKDVGQLVDAVLSAMQLSYTNRGGGAAQLYATGPFNQPDNSKTGVNPAWRKALWHVVIGAAWTSTTPPNVRTQIQNSISASVQPLKALTPGGGCYMNEGDWMEENWQQTFFGDNYDRLLDVKKRYDPTGLFSCWKCVGWKGYDE